MALLPTEVEKVAHLAHKMPKTGCFGLGSDSGKGEGGGRRGGEEWDIGVYVEVHSSEVVMDE